MRILFIKSVICVLTCSITPLINNSGVILNANNPIIADHHAVAEFENIPDSILAYTIPISLMFQHASVGGTINDGLNCVQGTRTNPSECREFPEYKYDRRNWEFQPIGNSGWYGKLNYFLNSVESQIDKFDIFSFKYCYLDGLDGLQEPCGSPFDEIKVVKAWTSLRDTMESLERRHPDKKFIWWTIPLTQVGMVCTDTLNTYIRNYVKTNGKILFDIADIECYDTLDAHVLNENGLELAFKPYCGEQQPGAQACHPGWLGKLRLAKAFWWMMTKIAEQSITDVKESITKNSNNFFTVQNSDNVLIINLKNKISGVVKISLYDIMGKEIFSRVVEDDVNNKIEINIRSINIGLYFLAFSNGEKYITEKIIM